MRLPVIDGDPLLWTSDPLKENVFNMAVTLPPALYYWSRPLEPDLGHGVAIYQGAQRRNEALDRLVAAGILMPDLQFLVQNPRRITHFRNALLQPLGMIRG